MSITVTNIGQNMAMDGHRISKVQAPPVTPVADTPLAREVQEEVFKAPETVEHVKAQVQQLQDISDILGRKLLFNVNEEINKVVVTVIDPSTNKVIKEIPSQDVQRLQARIRETLGLLIDETI